MDSKGAKEHRVTMRLGLVLVFVCALAAPVGALSAQVGSAEGEDLAAIVFTEVERRIIKEFFGKGVGQQAEAKESKDKDKPDKDKGKAQEMPPGLAQRDQLPPGLARHLEKYGTLPPGLEKRRLPGDLESLLPRARPGIERVIVDDDVFLIQKATGLVLDILLDVIK